MDELVTHDDVLRWLPRDVRHELTMSLSPGLRGWYTRDEAFADGGRFVEVMEMSWREPRLIRTGD